MSRKNNLFCIVVSNIFIYFNLLAHPSKVLVPHTSHLSVLLLLSICTRYNQNSSITYALHLYIQFVHYLLPNPSYTFLLSLLVVRPTVNPIPLPSSLFFTLQTALILSLPSRISFLYSLPISPVFFPVSFISPPFHHSSPSSPFSMLQSFLNPSVLFIFFSHFSRARFPALLFLGPIDIFSPFILAKTLGVSRA